WRRGRVEAAFAAVLFGFSFLLVAYSSEARGYACALCFGLLASVALDRYLERGGWRDAAMFVTAVILGSLSQPVFRLFYGSLLIWGSARILDRSRRGGDRWSSRGGEAESMDGARSGTDRTAKDTAYRAEGGRPSVWSLLAWQAIPLVALLALYVVDLRHMEVGSGDSYPWTEVAAQTIGHLL